MIAVLKTLQLTRTGGNIKLPQFGCEHGILFVFFFNEPDLLFKPFSEQTRVVKYSSRHDLSQGNIQSASEIFMCSPDVSSYMGF